MLVQRERQLYRYIRAVWAIEQNRVQFAWEMVVMLSICVAVTGAVALTHFSALTTRPLFFAWFLIGFLFIGAFHVFAYPSKVPFTDEKIISMQGVVQSYSLLRFWRMLY